MKLWVTPSGDKWLCSECQEEYEEIIEKENWRVAFEKEDPMLRCAKCQHSDMDIMD